MFIFSFLKRFEIYTYCISNNCAENGNNGGCVMRPGEGQLEAAHDCAIWRCTDPTPRPSPSQLCAWKGVKIARNYPLTHTHTDTDTHINT